MDLSLLAVSTVTTFLLILTRVSGMMLSGPVFNVRGLPVFTKVGMAFTVSILFFPLYAGVSNYTPPQTLPGFMVMAGSEFIIGLLIGFVADMVFVAVRMAGEYVAIQMGLSMASVLDPVLGTQAPVIGEIYYIVALWLFLSLNIHHALILGVNKSFQWIPLGQGISHLGILTQRVIALGSDMFVLSLLIAMPVLGVLLVLELALSYVAKVMPQMNIFIVSMPLKSCIGLLVLMVSFPFLSPFLRHHYAELIQHVMGLLRGV